MLLLTMYRVCLVCVCVCVCGIVSGRSAVLYETLVALVASFSSFRCLVSL